MDYALQSNTKIKMRLAPSLVDSSRKVNIIDEFSGVIRGECICNILTRLEYLPLSFPSSDILGILEKGERRIITDKALFLLMKVLSFLTMA